MQRSWFQQAVEVIPAVDVLGDDAVRLERGDYDRVIERTVPPAELAAQYAGAGARWVHVVDLDGARAGGVRPDLVADIHRAAPGLRVQASGGVRAIADAEALLSAGAERVIVGTAAVHDPGPWVAALGDRLVLALDVLGDQVRTRGWTEGAGLTLAAALDRAAGAGVGAVHLTAIDRDGTLLGPDVDLVRTASTATDTVRVMAAGGVRSVRDVAALAAAGAQAVVVGRALLVPEFNEPADSPTVVA